MKKKHIFLLISSFATVTLFVLLVLNHFSVIHLWEWTRKVFYDTYEGIYKTIQDEKTADLEYLSSIDIPIVVIDTEDEEEPSVKSGPPPKGCFGVKITSNGYIKSNMKIILNDKTLFKCEKKGDEYPMKIKVRGNTTALYDKKPYKIKFDDKEDPIDGDSNYADKEFILLACEMNAITRSMVGFILSKHLGMQFVPRYRFVNLVLNNNYRGIYILTENVKRSDKRIKISKTGFINEYDSYWWTKNNVKSYFKTKSQLSQSGYTFKYPKKVKSSDKNYIFNYITEFENSICTETYDKFIDVDSWCMWLIGHDIVGTSDYGGSNIYISKYDRTEQSRLVMPCLWDFDTMFFVPDTCFARIHDMRNCSVENWFYFKELLSKSEFKKKYYNLWKEVGNEALDKTVLELTAFKKTNLCKNIEKARLCDRKRWNYKPSFSKGNLEKSIYEELDNCISHLRKRQFWLNNNISIE